ncbi:hypothetical protein [Actinokineospora sp.]|uniref:hypothetical protein n=1 Tax=Actinokineospora sp. TaxID=1872133 RepID=UPI003D6AB1D5
MAGRHSSKAANWHMPVALAVTTGAVLAATAWVTGTDPDVRNASAAMVMAPPVTTTSTTTTTTTTVAPTTTTTPPPVTTTPPPVTTTKVKTTPPPPASSCSTKLDGAQPHVAQVGNHIAAKFGVDDIGGAAGRSGTSDHPEGLALDFMVDTAKGNAIADYVLANRRAFAVTYVIWRQRYNDGSGWSAMEDRGGATANHYDHVHVSFRAGAKVSVTC